MAKMNVLAVVCAIWMVGLAGAIDFALTHVAASQVQTIPPTNDKDKHEHYVQTAYKETNSKTMIHTVYPLRPSYEILYLSTELTTVNTQNTSTSSMEFATSLNSTVLVELTSNDTWYVAATHYQTIDFTSEEIHYTPVTGDTKTAVTVTETNALPFV